MRTIKQFIAFWLIRLSWAIKKFKKHKMKKTILILLMAVGFLNSKSQVSYTYEKGEDPETVNVCFTQDHKEFYEAVVKYPNTEKQEVELLNPPENYDQRSTMACYVGNLVACQVTPNCAVQLAALGSLGLFEIWAACLFNVLH